MAERITFATLDRITLVGDWVPAPTTLGAIVLMHMMPATRTSWAPFQELLVARGIASLAIDLRGHGESTHSAYGTLDYRTFTDEIHEQSSEDVRAAFEWVRSRQVERGRIALAGASIGANLALQFLNEEPQIPGAVLLSPGLDYHGVTALDAAERVLPHQGVWMAASQGDDDASVNAMERLEKVLAIESKVVHRVTQQGHGTTLFKADTALMTEAADWLRERILTV